ncbi:MAG TPA: RdgB/HAM1 family non-canonical purine NTP pyrophosphatase [Tissierellia bacterium]|nr:RdgB/HAM1 family non-canonical purine NTP pyrophosphatase [Tissierellia bacterium]
MERRRLILSTGNLHKVREIKDILKDLPIEVISKDELGFKDFDIEEYGKTLEENAIIKARALWEKVDGMVMADDTGLFVDYLNGEPGINSARYSGPDGNSERNIAKLLDRLKGVPMEKRTATFITVIALITEDGETITVRGECKGHIGFEKKGGSGFGYDPLFIVEGYGRTFAELGEEIKNTISHRAKALYNIRNEIINILEDGKDENTGNK